MSGKQTILEKLQVNSISNLTQGKQIQKFVKSLEQNEKSILEQIDCCFLQCSNLVQAYLLASLCFGGSNTIKYLKQQAIPEQTLKYISQQFGSFTWSGQKSALQIFQHNSKLVGKMYKYLYENVVVKLKDQNALRVFMKVKQYYLLNSVKIRCLGFGSYRKLKRQNQYSQVHKTGGGQYLLFCKTQKDLYIVGIIKDETAQLQSIRDSVASQTVSKEQVVVEPIKQKCAVVQESLKQKCAVVQESQVSDMKRSALTSKINNTTTYNTLSQQKHDSFNSNQLNQKGVGPIKQQSSKSYSVKNHPLVNTVKNNQSLSVQNVNISGLNPNINAQKDKSSFNGSIPAVNSHAQSFGTVNMTSTQNNCILPVQNSQTGSFNQSLHKDLIQRASSLQAAHNNASNNRVQNYPQYKGPLQDNKIKKGQQTQTRVPKEYQNLNYIKTGNNYVKMDQNQDNEDQRAQKQASKCLCIPCQLI